MLAVIVCITKCRLVSDHVFLSVKGVCEAFHGPQGAK